MSTRVARVGDLAEQIRGVTFPKSEAVRLPREGYLPVLRAGNIGDGGLDLSDDLVYVPASRIHEKQMLRRNDVLIAASSGSLRVVGKAARCTVDFSGTFGAFCKVLRPSPIVDPSYFAHYFKTFEYRRTVSSLAEGANINNLRSEHLNGLVIPLPPLEEQRRIAAILDQADALRAKRQHELELLGPLTESAFVAMFGDPVTNSGEFASQILADWVPASVPITYGILKPGPDVPNGVPYIRVVDIANGGIKSGSVRRTTPDIAASYRRSQVAAGDMVISIRGHVGRVGIVPSDLDGANITQDSARIRVAPLERAYVAAALSTHAMKRWMVKHTKGVAVRGINLGDLRDAPLPRPANRDIAEFGRRIAAVERMRIAASLGITQSNQLVSSLQARAFAGEL